MKRTRLAPGAYEVKDDAGNVLGRYGGRENAKWAETASGKLITEGSRVSVKALIGLIVYASKEESK